MTNNAPLEGMTPEFIKDLDKASGDMYDVFYDLLATYQFDFTLEEKVAMLDKIYGEILEITKAAE